MDTDNPTSIEALRARIVLPTDLVPIDNDFPDPEAQQMIPESQRLVKFLTKEDEQARFWNMLVDTVAASGYKPPVGRPTQVLDVGCGSCYEGAVLNAFLGGSKFGEASDTVHVTGIDIDKRAIASAQNDYESNPQFTFILGDATQLETYPQIPRQVDMAVFRHQEAITETRLPSWKAMFGQAIDRLSPGGIMLMTSFDEEQDASARELLAQLPCEVVLTKKNPYAFPHFNAQNEAVAGIDGVVTVVKKTIQQPK